MRGYVKVSHRIKYVMNMCFISGGNIHLTNWFCRVVLGPTTICKTLYIILVLHNYIIQNTILFYTEFDFFSPHNPCKKFYNVKYSLSLICVILEAWDLNCVIWQEEHEQIRARSEPEAALEWTDYKSMTFTQCVSTYNTGLN